MSASAKDAARAIAVRLATTKYAYDDSRIAAITQALRRYAKLAVAAEREACASLCEDEIVIDRVGGSTGNAYGTAHNCAAAIRARR